MDQNNTGITIRPIQGQIPLDTTPEPQQLSLGGSPPAPSQPVAAARAAKADMGLSALTGMKYDDIYQQIANGAEDSFRQQAASALDVKTIQDKQQQLKQLAIQRGRDLTYDEVKNVIQNTPTNPDTVIENSYAHSMFGNQIQQLNNRNPDNVIATAQQQNPDEMQSITNAAGTILGRREYMLKKAQDIQSEVDNDTWLKIPFITTPLTPDGNIQIGSKTAPWSSALNWATFGMYGGLREEYLMRGNTPDTSRLAGIFESSNVDEQGNELLTDPSDQSFKDKFDRGFERLKAQDPTLAQKWATEMAGMSVGQIFAGNVSSALNIIGGYAGGKIVKDVLKAAGRAQVRELGRAVTGPYREAQPRDAGVQALGQGPQTNTEALAAATRAVEDVLRNSPASPTKANVAEALGDTKEAAVQRVIESHDRPDPVKDSIDTLMSIHKQNQQLIRDNPGSASREELTRMLDAGEGFERDATDKLVNTYHVVRLPELAENGFRDIADRVREYFKGDDNAIVDVEMSHDPVTNVENHVITFGNADGRPWSSAQLARNWAARHGYENPEIVGNDPDRLYLPKAAVMRQDYTGDTPRWVPNPQFVFKQDKDGYRFFLGHPDGTEAEVMARINPEPTDIPFNTKTGKFEEPLPYGPTIQQKGVGYFVKWNVPLDETQSFVRDALIGPRTESASTAAKNSRWSRITNGILGYFRLPADTLSKAENENRAKSVYANNRYMELAQGQMKYIEDLYHGLLDNGNYAKRKSLSYLGNLTGRNKQVWNDFVRALTVAQTADDPVTHLPGYYMKTPAEIQHFWQTNFGRPASFPEQQAYLAASRLDYLDWVFRNVGVYRNKARRGVMEHTLVTTTKDSGEKITSTPFEGAMLKSIPEGPDRVVLVHKHDGSTAFYNTMGVQGKKNIKEQFEKGELRGVQIDAPEDYPINIKDKDGNPIRVEYVLSDSLHSKPLSYKQVGYRGGGHWDYNYDRYVKQPIMRKQTVGGKTMYVYDGDATFAPVKSHIDGENISSTLNQIRDLIKDKKIAEAKALHQSIFDQEWKDFVKGFFPTKDRTTGMIKPSRFNLAEDFRVVPKGTTIADYDKNLLNKYSAIKNSSFIDATRQHSPARNYQVEFTGARDSYDLFEPYNTGTIYNPLYKFKPAELIDPITTQTRALRRIVNSMEGDNYKYSAVEHWLQENMDLIDGKPEEIRGSPFWYFLKGQLKRNTGLRGQIAEQNRYKIRKLVGMPTYIDSIIHDVKQELSDAMYETDNPLVKKALVVPTWMLDKVSSPTNFVRSMAFHENLGLFNWAQLAAQSMGWINVAALSPDHTLPAMFGAWMHIWSRVNMRPSILNKLDNMAETFGWKPGEWQQAMRDFERSGFNQLGNSLVVDNPNKQTFLVGEGKRLLRNGTIFFDLAEQNVRYGAWYAAYHEFKRAFPDAEINDVAIGKILRRANDIYMNMGRDSKTLLNTGIGSMTLQFYKYIENVGQMFFSKRIGDVIGKENTMALRAQQRAQMILMYSLAFGPVGATGLSLFPFSDWIREHELKQGYVPGQNFFQTLLMEGPLSMAGAYASGWARTGSLDMSKGTFYNYNNRYGANGYQLLRDLLEPSNTFWKILMGAGGSSLANTMQSLSPFVYAMSSSYNDEQNAPFAVTLDDWKELARNANSFRYGERLVRALEFGKWMDRHGRNIQDISAPDAIFRSLLGTNDQNVDDAYLKHQIQQQEKSDYSAAEKEYQHYRRLAEQAAINKDPEQARIFNKNAIFALKSAGVPPEVASRIFAHDAHLNKNTLDTTNWSFYKQYVPTDRIGSAQKAWEQIQQNKVKQ